MAKEQNQGKSLDRSVTDSIKGIFILTVFYNHIMPYFNAFGGEVPVLLKIFGDKTIAHLGQLIVVMFLFYSGFGVMNSILTKGKSYVDNMPTHRICNTLFNFSIAVAVFWFVQAFIFDKQYDLVHILLSFVGWESVGNSNWYIFMILLLYALTYVVFNSMADKKRAAFVLVAFICVAIYVIDKFKPSYWTDTTIAYPAGILWCIYRDGIERFICRHMIAALMISASLVIVLPHISSFIPYIIMHNLRSLAFVGTVMTTMLLFPFSNVALGWLGKNLFPIYIYQRLPMIYFSEFDGGYFMSHFPYIYVLLCFVATLAIAWIYGRMHRISYRNLLGSYIESQSENK